MFRVLVSTVQFIFPDPWCSDFHWLIFIGFHGLESALDRGTAGVLINTLHQICVSYVPGGPSFPCLPTLVVDLSTEVPLTFKWTTLAEEFCKAFPDYTHHMFLLHSVQLCFQGMIVIDVQGPTVRSLWHSPVCYTLLASIVHFLTVGMQQHSCSVEFVTQVVTVPLTEPSVSDLWRPAVAQSLCASYRPGCFTTPSLDLTCPIFQVALTAVAVWWRINIYNTYL